MKHGIGDTVRVVGFDRPCKVLADNGGRKVLVVVVGTDAVYDVNHTAVYRDLQSDVTRRTLSQIELSGLRAELARRDRTRGWLS